jgi:hypothetical protein
MCWPAGTLPWRGSKEARALSGPGSRRARRGPPQVPGKRRPVITAVMIGIDPHKASHAIHMAAVTQVRQKHSEGRASSTRSSPRARPARRPCAHSSGRSATPSSRNCEQTPSAPRPRSGTREGNRRTTVQPARPDHTPVTGSSAKPLPGPGRRPTTDAPSPAPLTQSGIRSVRVTVGMPLAARRSDPGDMRDRWC